jgi:hypothetical protein
MNIKTLKKEIKGVFIQPKKFYYLGKLKHGTPYFYPTYFSNSIIKIKRLELNTKETPPASKFRKHKKFNNMPMVRRCKDWTIKIFGRYYYIEIGYPFKIQRIQLGWKDKWPSPRYEWGPTFQIFFFNWQFCVWWNAPDSNNNLYYEMILWYLNYSDKDINKAKETWSWFKFDTKESTWDNKYLI